MSLTPIFFEQLPIELLFHPGVTGDHFNSHKLGRPFDTLHDYICDTVFSLIAMLTCQQESVVQRFNSLDTTSGVTDHYDLDAIGLLGGTATTTQSDLSER